MEHETTIRLYRHIDDLDALTRLYNAVEGSSLTQAEVRERLSRYGCDPERDRFVALRDNTLVGMSVLIAQSSRRYFVQASVHPDHRRQGIGRALLERAVEECRARGAEQASGDTEARDQAGRLFALACGFTVAGEARAFTAPADWTPPDEPLPRGFAIQTGVEFGRLQTYADACNRCYHDMWGHYENLQPLTVEKIEEWRSRRPENYEPERMFVLFAPDGSPAGVTRVAQEGEGESAARVIDAPGIAPEFRALGRALYAPLISAAAGWLREHAQGRYEIQTWGDTPEAVEIYQRLGFRLDESTHSIEFVRNLR